MTCILKLIPNTRYTAFRCIQPAFYKYRLKTFSLPKQFGRVSDSFTKFQRLISLPLFYTGTYVWRWVILEQNLRPASTQPVSVIHYWVSDICLYEELSISIWRHSLRPHRIILMTLSRLGIEAEYCRTLTPTSLDLFKDENTRAAWVEVTPVVLKLIFIRFLYSWMMFFRTTHHFKHHIP